MLASSQWLAADLPPEGCYHNVITSALNDFESLEAGAEATGRVTDITEKEG
jgi:hypothetical protein